MAGASGPDLVQNGLVLALDAADKNSYVGSGTTWTDLSGNGNNGTLTNGPTFSSVNSGVIVFDGVDDYINCGNNSSLKLTGDITIDTWIYISANPSDWVRICGIGSSDGGSSNRIYGLWYNGTNASVTRNLLWQRYSPLAQIYPTSVILALNTWYYVSVTTNGSLHTLYLNGLSIDTTTSAGPWTTNTVDNVTIGYAGFHTYHTGRISLTRIYNRALTATEVLQNYNITKTRFGL
jgi:hypothetical protein